LNIFLPQKENEFNLKRIELIKDLFLPINLQAKIYWEYHFVIVGVDETSQLDYCKIF